jgi:hypothetical protein
MKTVPAQVATLVAVALACLAGCSTDDAKPAEQVQPLADAATEGSLDAGPVDAAAETEPEAEAGPAFDIDPKRIKADVAKLASEELQGRLPGTPGGEKALQHVEALFTELGLKPMGTAGWRQPFQFPLWMKTGPSAFTLDGAALVEGTDFNVMSYSGASSVESDLLFAGFGLTIPAFDKAAHPTCPYDPAGYDDYDGVDATGKIVIVMRHDAKEDMNLGAKCPANEAAKKSDDLLTFSYKAANARLHGAVGAVLVQDWSHEPDPIQGQLDASYFDAAFPVFTVNRDKLVAAVPELQSWVDTIKTSLKPNPQPSTVVAKVEASTKLEQVSTANVLGVVEGTDPALAGETIVIGAHVDHLGKDLATGQWYPGADDNASGTAVLMELARAAVLSGLKPKRTLLFAAFNAEEEGLLGSCYYVSKPTLPIATTKAMFSVDMVGAGDGSGLILYGATVPAFAWLAELMEASAVKNALNYDLELLEPLGASDDVCFQQAGVPALLALTRGEHGYYHTPQDTIDTILEEDLEAAARLLWVTLQPLALGEEGAR